jgi:hypothetical protein
VFLSKSVIFALTESKKLMASDKTQYIVALIAEFAAYYGISTVEAAQYFNRYKALELFDRQYPYLHTQSFASNIRDISAYCRRMGGTL